MFRAARPAPPAAILVKCPCSGARAPKAEATLAAELDGPFESVVPPLKLAMVAGWLTG